VFEPTFESVSCPLCFGDEAELVFVAPDFLNGCPGEFKLVKCKGCGLLRTNPRPTKESIGYYYPDDYSPYQTSLVKNGEKKIIKPNSIISLIKKNLFGFYYNIFSLPKGRMLEIGCASGSFLDRMKVQGWSVQGVEFSEKSAKNALSEGFDVFIGDVGDFNSKPGMYDLIVSWMVLEHLHDPVFALKNINQWLDDDGWFVFSIPDASSIDFKLFGKNWYALQMPTHLFHYTPKNISKLLSNAGFSVKHIQWQPSSSNLFFSISYACRERGWAILERLSLDIAEGKRFIIVSNLLGRVLGMARQSGRMVVWAKKVVV